MKDQKKELRLLFGTSIKRFLQLGFCHQVFLILGGLMFFYVDECFFFTPTEKGYNKRCKDLCDGIQKLNTSFENETTLNNGTTVVLSGLFEICNKEQCAVNIAPEVKRCTIDMLGFIKWTIYTTTILFTIGYGHIVPKSIMGKSLTMAYAIIGIPLTSATMFFCGRAISTLIKLVVVTIEERVLKKKQVSLLAAKTIFIEVALLISLILVHSWYFKMTGLKDHHFFDAVYFVFITLSTIGFGDINFDANFFEKLDPLDKCWVFIGDMSIFYVNFAMLASLINAIASLLTTTEDETKKKEENIEG